MHKLIIMAKIFLISFVILFGIFLFAKHSFSQDKFINFLKNKFYSDFNLKVDIGKVEIHFKYIEIRNFRIFDKQNQNKEIGFVEEVDVKLSPLFLISKKFTINALRFVRPKLAFNLDDFNTNSTLDQNTKDNNLKILNEKLSKLEFPSLSFKIQIVDGLISFKSKETVIELKNFNLSARNVFLNFFNLSSKIEMKSDANLFVKGDNDSLKKFGLDNFENISYKIFLEINLKNKKLILKSLDVWNDSFISKVKGEIFRDKSKELKSLVGDLNFSGDLKKPAMLLNFLRIIMGDKQEQIISQINIEGAVPYKFKLKFSDFNKENPKKYYLTGDFDFTKSDISYSDKLHKKKNINFLVNFNSILNFSEKFYEFQGSEFVFDDDKIILDGYVDLKSSENKKFEIKYKSADYGFNVSKLKDIVCFFDISKNEKDATLTGKLKIEGLINDSKKSLALTLNDIFYSNQIEIIEGLNGRIIFDDLTITVDNITGLVNGRKFDINFFISKDANLPNYFNLVLPVLNLDDIFSHTGNSKISKVVYLSGGFFYFFKKEDFIEGKISIGDLKYKNFQFSNVLLDTKYNNSALDVNAQFGFKTGKVNGNFKFLQLGKFFVSKKFVDIFCKADLNLENVNIDGLAGYFKQKYNFIGKVTGKLSFELLNTKIKNIVCDCVLTNGKITDFSFLEKLAQITKNVDFKNFSYEKLIVKLKFFDNVLAIENADLTSAIGKINLVGNVDFSKQVLDLVLNLDIKGNENRVDITGTFDNPNYKIYLQQVIQNIGKNLLSGGSKILQDLIK